MKPFGSVVAGVILLLAGCSAWEEPRLTLSPTDNALADTPRNVATHFDYGASPLAEMRATLVLVGGCLLARQSMGEQALPIWPSAFWLDGNRLMDGRRAVAAVGDTVRLIGGNYPAAEIPGELSNSAPEACLDLPSVFWVGAIARANESAQPPPGRPGWPSDIPRR